MIQITRVFLWIDFPSGDFQIGMSSFSPLVSAREHLLFRCGRKWDFRDINRCSRQDLKCGPFIACQCFGSSVSPSCFLGLWTLFDCKVCVIYIYNSCLVYSVNNCEEVVINFGAYIIIELLMNLFSDYKGLFNCRRRWTSVTSADAPDRTWGVAHSLPASASVHPVHLRASLVLDVVG